MSKPSQIRRALISVYDKTGLVEFARALHQEFGIELISTGGTAKVLKDAGLPVTLVEEITGFPEMLDGRVKTLHPKIHAAILADRDNPDHMRQLAEQGIEPIDMVVVNLYPFEQTIAKPGCTFEQAIEMIDIGGPCLLRAAAKNHRHTVCVPDVSLYEHLLKELRRGGGEVEELARQELARSAFTRTAFYDREVWLWLRELTPWIIERPTELFPEKKLLMGRRHATLRYGENPHQQAAGYRIGRSADRPPVLVTDPATSQEFSFNNYADASAALELCAELTRAGPRAPLSIAGSASDRAPALPRQEVWHRPMAGEPAAEARTASKPEEPPSSHYLIDDETAARRNLPHIQRPGATYFITFRTHQGQFSPEERDLVMDCCLFADRRQYCLHAAICMPDHVHLLLTPLEAAPRRWYSLTEILHDLKGNIGRRVAESRSRPGPVLQDESFDHLVRNRDDFLETLEYIRTNAERAKLAPGKSYPWLVVEEEPDWDAGTRSGAVDLEHQLSAHRVGERSWYERLAPRHSETVAAGTAPESTRPSANNHRPLAGATLAGGATPATGTSPVACFIKHTNACGTGIDADPVEAYRKSYLGDPNAAMGGILAVNFPVNAAFAQVVMSTLQRFKKDAEATGCKPVPQAFFVEVWLAPSFDDEAVKLIRGEMEPSDMFPDPAKKDWGKRVRLLAVGDMSVEPDPGELDFKRIAGGMLMQTRDLVGLNEDQWKVVTQRRPTEQELDDLRLAWLICKHTKSNAVTICKEGMLIGNGAGQMSRVMSCRIATWLAQENGHADQLKGAAAASDAFFPFRDGPDLLMDAGVTALIQPGGSKRDQEVIEACNARGAAMIFTGTRHFRH
jgi:AICAR transformylase/IMP cyclohydrolase PurH/REP element-mobilizing transposase RayT